MKNGTATRDNQRNNVRVSTHGTILKAIEGIERQHSYTDRDIDRILKRNSFGFWKYMKQFIEDGATTEEILVKIHLVIDDYRGYGSRTNSDYSLESLNFVLADVDSMKVRP